MGELEQCDILNLRVIAQGIKPKPEILVSERERRHRLLRLQ